MTYIFYIYIALNKIKYKKRNTLDKNKSWNRLYEPGHGEKLSLERGEKSKKIILH